MFEIYNTNQHFIDFHNSNKKSIGFVPTMGNLHQGHISLLEKSLQENEVSILSIYVNPTQFAKNEDLSSYPRTLEEDLDKIKKMQERFPNKNVIVFIPENETTIYPLGFNDFVTIPELNQVSEGEIRPTHFDGVATVVKRLFAITKPNKAYFGKKDYQQLVIIKKLVEKENLNVEIIGMPIIREPSGLAMSSRNNYLSLIEKEEATILSKTLNTIAAELQNNSFESAIDLINTNLKNKKFNYLEIRNSESFELAKAYDSNFVLLGNYQIQQTRLLDNIEVNK